MAKKNQTEKIKETTKNFKIRTRIALTSVLAIVIPIIIIVSFATVFLNTMASKFDFSSVTTTSYSLINNIQWNQTVTDISNALISGKDDEETLGILKGFISPIETLDTSFYIEKNGEPFYKSEGSEINFDEIDKTENAYSFKNNDLTIISHANDATGNRYTIVIKNNSYTVPENSAKLPNENYESLITSRTIIIVAVIIFIFILTIVIISLITSNTLIKPINKISAGADELSKGNLDYQIDYKSKNELGMLADNFNNMSSQIKYFMEKQQRADTQQKEMIAGIAHDLRTPLTSIKGYVEGLRDGIADTPEKKEHYLNTIYASTCDTEKMLDDLLTISKLELGNITLNFEEVSIDDFIAFTEDLKNDLAEKDFDFEVINNAKTNPSFKIDTDRFARVISNIISNSVKYKQSDRHGKITLSVSEYSQSVIFEIKDNGMGVDKQSLPRIFDTLYRADKARSNVRDGSGLGLSVCKQIIELHGGLIWAQSELGNGLSIYISLPIEQRQLNKESGNEKNSDN